MLKDSSLEDRLLEVGANEADPSEVGAVEAYALEVRIIEQRLAEVGSCERHSAQLNPPSLTVREIAVALAEYRTQV